MSEFFYSLFLLFLYFLEKKENKMLDQITKLGEYFYDLKVNTQACVLSLSFPEGWKVPTKEALLKREVALTREKGSNIFHLVSDVALIDKTLFPLAYQIIKQNLIIEEKNKWYNQLTKELKTYVTEQDIDVLRQFSLKDIIDAIDKSHDKGLADDAVKKKRGRPKGSTKKAETTPTTTDTQVETPSDNVDQENVMTLSEGSPEVSSLVQFAQQEQTVAEE